MSGFDYTNFMHLRSVHLPGLSLLTGKNPQRAGVERNSSAHLSQETGRPGNGIHHGPRCLKDAGYSTAHIRKNGTLGYAEKMKSQNAQGFDHSIWSFVGLYR